MYDHLPPRLAKYLAQIYTGTDVGKIERQDARSRVDEFANVWRSYKKLERWNKQRGQTINQLNQRIHEQRLKIGRLNRLLEHEKCKADYRLFVLELYRRDLSKVEKWNNAHKREIAQLQSKLHYRRAEVKFLLRQLEDRNSLLKLKNQSIDDLVGMLHDEKRKARELKRQVDKLNELADVSCRVNHEFNAAVRKQDEELADWYEYVQLLIAKLNEKEKQLKLSNLEVGVGKKKGMACMNNLTIETVIDDHGAVPAYSRDGDAAIDLRASENCYIKAGAVRLVDTGVRVAIPSGYVGLVCPRSGMACKHEVTVINAPGVIDPNYRGSIKVGLVNHNSVGFDIREGDRIAQLLIVPVPRVTFEQVEELDDTERGADGFGSSGR